MSYILKKGSDSLKYSVTISEDLPCSHTPSSDFETEALMSPGGTYF